MTSPPPKKTMYNSPVRLDIVRQKKKKLFCVWTKDKTCSRSCRVCGLKLGFAVLFAVNLLKTWLHMYVKYFCQHEFQTDRSFCSWISARPVALTDENCPGPPIFASFLWRSPYFLDLSALVAHPVNQRKSRSTGVLLHLSRDRRSNLAWATRLPAFWITSHVHPLFARPLERVTLAMQLPLWPLTCFPTRSAELIARGILEEVLAVEAQVTPLCSKHSKWGHKED